MLKTFTPVVALRQAARRTVFNGIWTAQLRNSYPESRDTLLAYLREQPLRRSAGDLHSFLKQPPRVSSAMLQEAIEVAKRLSDLGLLAPAGTTDFERGTLLMACRGTQPHMDINNPQWTNRLFWAMCLEDTDADVMFGNLGYRTELNAGTLIVFDPCQPHAVVAREQPVFMKSHFPRSRVQYFIGGDFPTDSWTRLGVHLNPKGEDYDGRIDVMKSLVHQRTCLLKRTG